MNDKPNLIVDLTFDFSLKIIVFSEELEAKRKFNMANQIFRCGTSIGANVREAQGAESKEISDSNTTISHIQRSPFKLLSIWFTNVLLVSYVQITTLSPRP